MSRPSTACSRLCLIALLGAAVPRLCAQDPTLSLAEQLVAAAAPEHDDGDLAFRQLLTAALAAPRSPVAALLAEQAAGAQGQLNGRDELAQWLQAQLGREPLHGLLQDQVHSILHRFRQLGSLPPESGDAFADRARCVAVVGPFGDSGRHWLDVSFPPDTGFPALDQRLPGRFGEVQPRVIEREPDRDDLSLPPPERRRPGCYYVLWRVRAAAATAGFLEVGCRGPFAASVDGTEVGRFDPSLQPGSPVQRFPVRLQPGEHRLVIKTGDDGDGPLSLRLIDAAGAPLPQVAEVDPNAAPPAPPAQPPAQPPTQPPTAPPGPNGDTQRGGGPRPGPVFRSGLEVLEQAAATATGTALATLRVAGALTAQRHNEVDRCLALLDQLEAEPPTVPTTQLALASVLLRTTALPEELRTARARALEDAAIAALPGTHFAALAARVRQLSDQDQREQALRLLRAQIDAGRAGAATFELLYGVVRRLRFDAEIPPLLQRWMAQCPGDATPLNLWIEWLRGRGAHDQAWQTALQHQAQHLRDEGLQHRAFELALDQGAFDEARRLLDRTLPAAGGPSQTLRRLRALATLAARAGDRDALRALLPQLMDHPNADAAVLREVADRWLGLGDDAHALAAVRQSLQLDPDQPVLQELRERLGGAPAPGADFARFRRDGDVAIAAFTPGADENGASTSLLIDQRLVELLPDGAALVEVHELRRINDLQGVEALRTASEPASADEVLLLRTVAKDGRSYEPTRVDGGFSMPRLEPGAFVEWRFRRRLRSPGADPWRLEDFLLASYGEPLHHTEFVLIVPDGARGALRTRNLDQQPQPIALDGGRTAWSIARDDVARLPEETSPPTADVVVPLCGYGEDASPWPALRQQHAALLWRTRPTPAILRFAADLLAGADNDGERLQRIWRYCQDEIGDGDASDATEVFLRKKGNRFLLTVALLRAAGVPMQAGACQRTRSALAEDDEPLFATGDFAALPCVRVGPATDEPLWLFVDAPRYWPLGAVPAHRQGAIAFAVDGSNVAQLRLPNTGGAVQQLDVQGTCTVADDSTTIAATVRVGDFTGFMLADQLRRRTADVRKIAARQLGQQFFRNWRVRSATPRALDPGGEPLQIDLELQDAGPQPAGAGRWLLPLPLPTSDLRRAFGDRDERTLPLQLGADIDYHHHLAIDLGPDRALAELPAPLLVAFGPLDYQLVFVRDGDHIVVDRRLRVRPETVSVAVYGDWIRWLAMIDQKEQQRLVLVRTAAR